MLDNIYDKFKHNIINQCYNNYNTLYTQHKLLAELQDKPYPIFNINTFTNDLSVDDEHYYENHCNGIGFLYNITPQHQHYLVDKLIDEIAIDVNNTTVYDIYKLLLHNNTYGCNNYVIQKGGKQDLGHLEVDPFQLKTL